MIMSPRHAVGLWQQGGGKQAQPELQTLPQPAAAAPYLLSHQELAGHLPGALKRWFIAHPHCSYNECQRAAARAAQRLVPCAGAEAFAAAHGPTSGFCTCACAGDPLPR